MPAEVESMAYSLERGVPWHRLGEAFDGVMTAEEALTLAGLDWEVELRPVYTRSVEGTFDEIQTRRAVVRQTDESALGVVGQGYVPLQNRDAFAFADNLVDSSEAKYETAASLRGGRTVFLLMRMEGFTVDGADQHDMYLLLTNSHDGLSACTCLPTAIRVVCKNTLNLALSTALRKWSARHVTGIEGRLQEAREALGLTLGYRDALQAELESLLAQPFTERRLQTALNIVVPDRPNAEAAREEITRLYVDAETNAFGRGTKLAALNAVGEYFDWVRDPRTAESQVIGTMLGGAAAKARDRMLAVLSR